MRRFILPLLLLSASAATAQTTRLLRPTQLWPEVQGELVLKNGDYLLLALRGERSTTDLGYDKRPLGFDTRRARLAYEHFWSTTWSWGGAVQLAGSDGKSAFIPEVLLRHRSPIFGGLTFGQRLSLERSFAKDDYVHPLGSGPDGQFWTRLRVDVEKQLPLGRDAATGLALRPRLSYEASTHLRLQKATDDPDERTIQYTSLRAEVGVRVAPGFDLTPWFAYQTAYTFPLPQYDMKGNQLHGPLFDKQNLVYPTIGLDLRYTILPVGGKADRQPLPTQH